MPTSKKAAPSPTPFEKFHTLARQLVAVPREELENEQAKYERQRKKKPKQNSRKAMFKAA